MPLFFVRPAGRRPRRRKTSAGPISETASLTATVSTARWNLKEAASKALDRRIGSASGGHVGSSKGSGFDKLTAWAAGYFGLAGQHPANIFQPWIIFNHPREISMNELLHLRRSRLP